MVRVGPPSIVRERIRSFFLQPRECYDLGEAARIGGMTPRKLRREVMAGDRDGMLSDGSLRFTWRQVALLVFERWSLAEIHEALGADAGRVLPPLLALRAVTVRLPEYVLLALETYAKDRGTTLDHYLYWELIDFAGKASDDLGRRIPGFRQAYLFPGQP